MALPDDAEAVCGLATTDHVLGIPACRPADILAAMAGQSTVDSWFWRRLGVVTTLVVEEHGRICGAGSVAIGRIEMDGTPALDRWLLWVHAREDAGVLDTLLDALFDVGDTDRAVHAFCFATPLAYGLEALPVGSRPVTDARLSSHGLARRQQWTMMHTTARTEAPEIAYVSRSGGSHISHVEAVVDGTRIGEAEVSLVSASSGILWWLSIPEEHRGQGFGRQMLRAARSVLESQGAEEVTLFVDDDDPRARDRRPALQLYASEGFKVVDRLASYHGIPQPVSCDRRPGPQAPVERAHGPRRDRNAAPPS